MRAAVTTALAGVDKKTTNAGVSVGRQVQVWSDQIQRIAQGEFSVLSIFFLITITTIFPRLRLLCDMAQWPTQG
jgi:hypothetical protein